MSIGPEIWSYRELSSRHTIWQLRVPECWLVSRKYPRLALSWWLLKLVWVKQDKQP